MSSQKDQLHKVAQDFALIDQCFPITNRHHQHTGPTMGWTTIRYSPHDDQEYEDRYEVQYHQNQSRYYSGPQARTVLMPVITISSSDHVMKSTDHVYQVHHVTKANHANQVPFDVFSGNQMETQGHNRWNSYQLPPAAARTNKSNFGGWRFPQG